ncbi:ScyD/ScyE family protein [Leifsonia sp. YIM 134122]|uniref:ScyD/ScyE family protein n=1 Tax=Leifsonia stereocauli TaxID=3134136 RepID=A0ABU9W2R0_9MICO
MRIRRTLLSGAAVAALVLSSLLAPAAASATTQSGGGNGHGGPAETMLVSGLQGASGSTIGPDGALYVTEGAIGQVTRVDLRTGATSPLVTGLPPAIIGIGGAIDVAFIGRTAYVLVTMVGDDVPGATTNDTVGIYRVDGPDSFTVVADIGQWSIENPPPADIDIFIARGVQFAMQPSRGGFLVTDGHHNRVLKVSLSGAISQLVQFGNIVPTGLTTRGSVVYMAEAGPVPHDPATGKVVSFGRWNPNPRDVASGYSLLVDVEYGACGLYALSQGDSPGAVPEGSPALPDSGELLKVNRNGTFSVVVDGLDLPTSVDFRGDTAYVVTLGGEVWKITDIANHHRGGCGGTGHHGR